MGKPCRNKLNGVAQEGEFNLLRWWGSVVYITSSRRTVRLGLLQGVYERFPIKKVNQVDTSHTGGRQEMAPMLYSMGQAHS